MRLWRGFDAIFRGVDKPVLNPQYCGVLCFCPIKTTTGVCVLDASESQATTYSLKSSMKTGKLVSGCL